LQTTFLHEDRIVAHSTSASAALSERFGTLFRYWLCATALIAGTLFSFASFAQTYGTLDTSWGGTGFVNTAVAPPAQFGHGGRARGIAVQLDGKVVVSGMCYGVAQSGTTYFPCLARYNTNGTLDTSFNGTGTVTYAPLGNSTNYDATAIALTPYGQIVIVTGCKNASNVLQLCAIRFTKNGSVDTTFGIGGKLTTNITATTNNFASSVAFQSDGRLIIGGLCGSQICALRYFEDGSGIDPSFGGGGQILNPATGTTNRETFLMTVDANDRVVLAGTCSVSSREVFCVSRFSADGVLDTSFGTNGIVAANLFTSSAYAYGITIQEDSKILLAGETFNTIAGENRQDFTIVRYTSSGAVDTAFGNNGVVITRVANWTTTARAVVSQIDGKIIVAGLCQDFPERRDRFCLTAYNADGSLDTSFNGSGISKLLLLGEDAEPYAMTLGRDGKLLVAGQCQNGTSISRTDLCVARYNTLPTGGVACVVDLSGDNNVLATQDSLALARITRGVWNNDPSAVVFAFNNTISSPQQYWLPFKRWSRGSFDYDGDGLETITDALIHARVALGYTDTGVTNGLPFSSNATRTTWTALRNHFVNRCGLTLP
jgi:uncharacterized delta-60 repeat protein